MSAFTSEEVSKRLVDFSIMMKYMPFLQEHGFSEFGKGQLTGKMELLKESFSDSPANRLGPHFDVRTSFNQIDATPTPDYEELRVKTSDSLSIEGSSNSGESVNKMSSSTSGDKNSINKTAEKNKIHNAFDHSGRGKYLPENNRWNIENDDDSSWITRIRKLADM
ncbi:MAG: hypothetical protein GEU26_04025 [Nitrososphaeraceae archaeon]|nr:hypothetical protein [Nitrososphaeraceae archaeon]